MGIVHSSKGSLRPVSDHLLSEPVIVCRLAKAVFGEKADSRWNQFMEDYDHIRDAIEATIPGFSDYNRRVRIPGGFYLPNSVREGKVGPYEGRAPFTISKSSPVEIKPDEFLMMTIRSHDQFNTTIYGLNDRYRGVYNERRVIFMNEEDVRRMGLIKGDVVDLYNGDGVTERVAHRFIVIPFSIPVGCTATYFPETNVLVPIDSVAEKSNTPTSKSVVIRIRKSS
jgi:anaerobic selenocysteine-containing dehydrogenase